ncbi:homoserine kinase [Oscillatoriales cyanobacterium LEGE 11467]|uniref:Homoserine kinase n=1 Tax=Zarconia navalis LEGE 11467 TaxID=1828826 RepID=A0A928VYP7_9CYAN|nr:homoserine kinase [Zarconia navalis]MBE9040588.1 homoserine kinase [Zarconia navalis LEGE 11467]
MTAVKISVPGTTANIGPGFDCLGAALTLHNHFVFSPLEGTDSTLEIRVTGLEADRVTADESNLAYQAFAKFYQHLGKTRPPVAIEIELGVPLARGLGSSATAIVGGLMGANQLAEKPLTQAELMQLAIEIEGHPDNVVPALLGGCRLAASEGSHWQICEIPWHSDIVPVVAIPDFELSTAEARKVLPTEYSRADAIFNPAHLGLLLRGLETGNSDWLRVGTLDRIHQPYRQTLIPGYDAVRQAALAAGAYGMTISGAGPTLLALSSPIQTAEVTSAMRTAWQGEGITSTVRSLQIDRSGATVG